MMGGVGIVVFIVFALAQLVAGFLGIEYELGTFWASAAIFVAFGLRFTAPITIGAFFGATKVWGWHWLPALAFAAPGLGLAVPGVLAALLAMYTERSRGPATSA